MLFYQYGFGSDGGWGAHIADFLQRFVNNFSLLVHQASHLYICTYVIIYEGDTPLAYCVPPYFGVRTAYLHFFDLAYCVPFNKKKQPFGAIPFT